jgi:flagellar protein FlaI
MTSETAEAGTTPSESGAVLSGKPYALSTALEHATQASAALASVVDERTVDVDPTLDEDAFFTTAAGTETPVTRYDLEQAVPTAAKAHLREVDRYWVDEPYAFVVVFRSTAENELKYYVVQPQLTPVEADLLEFLTTELRSSIPYDDDHGLESHAARAAVVIDEYRTLLDRYGLYPRDESRASAESDTPEAGSVAGRSTRWATNAAATVTAAMTRVSTRLWEYFTRLTGKTDAPSTDERRGLTETRRVRRTGSSHTDVDGPSRATESASSATLTAAQVSTLQYHLRCAFVGYGAIDPITHDVRVEDISCDGYGEPVFVHHAEYEQLITNVHHDREELDDFVRRLAQEAGSGISTRRPQVDATLPDGSRAQLTLGHTVADHGTNYTIRQFADVPYTPVDLLSWGTFSLDQMAFLWLCVENDKNAIFAGGTASGKTTCLNAISLFIPSDAKIVSIEDTREVELPQRNWIASVTRPAFAPDDGDAIDEFDLLEAALRQRPEYIVVGEVRGEEGRTAFQVMSTGHTTYTTFHADSVDEVIRRFTTDPINVSKSMFTALDVVCIQRSTRLGGRRVRRNASITEVTRYDPENDEITVKDVYRWRADADAFEQPAESSVLDQIRRERGWSRHRLETALDRRRIVLAYLLTRGITDYAAVAATFQATMRDPATVLSSIASETLEESLDGLRTMESIHVDVDATAEAMTPRPSPTEAVRDTANAVLAAANLSPSRAEATSHTEPGARYTTGLDPSSSGPARPRTDAGAGAPADVTRPDGTDGIEVDGEVDE